MNIVLSNAVRLSDIPDELYANIISTLQFPNPKWLENQRMGRWNRGITKVLKFYRRSGKGALTIPRGYMRQLLVMARHANIEVSVDDRRLEFKALPIRFTGTLKPFQQSAVNTMLSKDFGILCAPTGSGKTIMALSILARRQQPTLIIVHTKDLAYQWIARIENFLDCSPEDIGLIGDGKIKLGDKVTVALVQSLYKRTSEISKAIGHIIVDECHRAPSRTFTEAVSAFDSKYMLGLSATPYRRDGLSKLIFWHLGDVHHEVRTDTLTAAGDLLDVEVIFRPTAFAPYSDPLAEYSKMLTELVADDDRNRLITDDIANELYHSGRPGAFLILSDRKRHCLNLQGLLKHKHHIDSEVLTGDLNSEQRREIVTRINNLQSRVIIATGQLIGEGFDCAMLTTLFLATPIRFSGRLLQYLGRVLRPMKGVEQARVYDYVDELVGPLKSAAKARERAYRHRKDMTNAGRQQQSI